MSGIFQLVKSIIAGKINPSKGGALLAAVNGMSKWNQKVADMIGSQTYDEFRAFAAKKGIWWSPILTADAVLQSSQAVACGAIVRDEKSLPIISSPVQHST